MSDCMRKNQAFIELLATTKSVKQRQALLETATPGQVRAFSEFCLNICRGRFKNSICSIDKSNRKRFLRKLRPVQKAASACIPFRKKRNALSKAHKLAATGQSGAGLFSVLLPLAANILPALLK